MVVDKEAKIASPKEDSEFRCEDHQGDPMTLSCSSCSPALLEAAGPHCGRDTDRSLLSLGPSHHAGRGWKIFHMTFVHPQQCFSFFASLSQCNTSVFTSKNWLSLKRELRKAALCVHFWALPATKKEVSSETRGEWKEIGDIAQSLQQKSVYALMAAERAME